MNGFPAQGQADPQTWGQVYDGRSNPFNAMRNQQRISAIPGRVVQQEDMIRPNDVPMDGSVALFPLQDMSCIFGKAWNTNGQIITVRYVPEQQPQQAPQVDPFQVIDTRLTSIENLLASLIPQDDIQLESEKPKVTKNGGNKK